MTIFRDSPPQERPTAHRGEGVPTRKRCDKCEQPRQMLGGKYKTRGPCLKLWWCAGCVGAMP